MTSSQGTRATGTVAAKAISILAGTFGWTKPKLAAEVGCHIRTAQRWSTGQYEPSPRNRTKLRALVAELILVELADNSPRGEWRARKLREAARALMTAAEKAEEKAEREALAADIRSTLAAGEQRGPESYQEWRQRVGNPVQPEPKIGQTAQCAECGGLAKFDEFGWGHRPIDRSIDHEPVPVPEPAERKPFVSITTKVNPFELCHEPELEVAF